jgi:hypothetical protein
MKVGHFPRRVSTLLYDFYVKHISENGVVPAQQIYARAI